MFKKISVAAMALAAGLGVMNTNKVGSYVGTAWNKLVANVKEQVPLEFEIERARHELTQLGPEIKKNQANLAQELAAISTLKEDIAALDNNLKVQQTAMVRMTNRLEDASVRSDDEDSQKRADKISGKLTKALRTFKTQETEVKTKKKLLEAKEKSAQTVKEQLASMADQKRDLEVQISQLEAELKTVRLAQTRSKVQVDDSKLSQIKGTLADIRNRLKAEQKEAELAGEVAVEPAEEDDNRAAGDVREEVRKLFGETGKRADR